ncbi:MAG: patatin-like phospholipase family protein [Rhodothermales bacterium]|nr:patatin-like phospholipase family protein [Rhodothermales bacterium]
MACSTDPTLWGPLAERYTTKQPRKLLALDGGGIRGVITLEMLGAMENQLADRLGRGDDFRLCHYFDYIGGTSTGAIIAAGLARGMSVPELLDFYVKTGPEMFDKRFILRRLKSIYRSEPLERQLRDVFGEDTDLSPEHLDCLLLVVTQNVTTDSPWPISSNPWARYNSQERSDCNLRIPLWRLVRASTAAPVYFPPEVLPWDPDDPDKAFVFVDGGVTPYNNPAFLLYRMATQPAYCLGWETGEDQLLVISVGTGTSATLGGYDADRGLVSTVPSLPSNLLYTMLVEQDINCRTVGRCTYGAPIDRELGDMIPRGDDGAPLPLSDDQGRHFLYARYNVELTDERLEELGLGSIKADDVRKLDSVDHIDDMRAVGRAAGRQIDLAHFGPFVPQA